MDAGSVDAGSSCSVSRSPATASRACWRSIAGSIVDVATPSRWPGTLVPEPPRSRLGRAVDHPARRHRRSSGAGGADVGGQLAEQVEHAGRAVDHDVGEIGERVLLLGGRADQQPGQPSAAQLLDRLERLDVAEVVAAEERPPWRRARRPAGARPRPCASRGRGSRSRCGPARRRGRGPWRPRSSSGSSRSYAASGSSSRRVCTATASPFSSIHASVGLGPAQQARQLAGEAWRARAAAWARSPGGRSRSSARCRTGRARTARGRARRSRCRPRRGRRGRAPGGPGGR